MVKTGFFFIINLNKKIYKKELIIYEDIHGKSVILMVI